VAFADADESLRSIESIQTSYGAPSPDVAIIDLQLPDMDGRVLADSIRQKTGLRDLPVIFATFNGRPRPETGFTVLTKPLKIECSALMLFARAVSSGRSVPSSIRILLVEDNPVNRKVALIMPEAAWIRSGCCCQRA